jgi:hypothetical protein
VPAAGLAEVPIFGMACPAATAAAFVDATSLS